MNSLQKLQVTKFCSYTQHVCYSMSDQNGLPNIYIWIIEKRMRSIENMDYISSVFLLVNQVSRNKKRSPKLTTFLEVLPRLDLLIY